MDTPDNLKISAAKSSDLQQIFDLLNIDRINPDGESSTEKPSKGSSEFFDLISADPNNTLYVGENDEGIVATFQLTFIPSIGFGGHWRAQVESLRVKASHRNRGLGRSIMTWVCEQASKRDCRMVQLTSNKQRDHALEFYKKVGFTASHEGLKKYLR